MDCEPYPDEFFEIAEKREAENREWKRKERSNRILERYNEFYNTECASLPTGGPISIIELQALSLQSTIDALRCEHLNQQYDFIAIEDIEGLIEGLRNQADEFLERVRKLKGEDQ